MIKTSPADAWPRQETYGCKGRQGVYLEDPVDHGLEGVYAVLFTAKHHVDILDVFVKDFVCNICIPSAPYVIE